MRSGEAGFTLPELLIAALIGLLVVGAGVSVFTAGIRSEPRVSDRTDQIRAARTLAERISREVRQGWAAPTATASQLAVQTYVKRAACGGAASATAIPCEVTYDCSSASCTRTERNLDGLGGGTPVQVVEGLGSSNVFSYLPSASAPTYVGIRLEFAASPGEDAITLEDGVTFRNDRAPEPG